MERNEQIRKMRREGMTLQAIADMFDLTRQRVQQIAGTTLLTYTCEICGDKFQSYYRSKYCDDCAICALCHRPISRTSTDGVAYGKQRYHAMCHPDYRPKGKATSIRVEQGIYARVYQGTGELVPGKPYFCHDWSRGKVHAVAFSTIKEARKYRASNVWRKFQDPNKWRTRG